MVKLKHFAYVLVVNNGIIINFGCINAASISGWWTIYFPIAYNNTNYFLEVTEVNSSYRSINLDGTHQTYFRLENISVVGNKNRWFALGY